MGDDFVIKLRGLPWSCSSQQILDFFEGCNIEGGKNGIHLTTNEDGRASGEAFVEISPADLDEACKRDRKCIGQRYIEVFKTRRSDMEYAVRRNDFDEYADSFRNGNDQKYDYDNVIRMRGLPFDCSKEDILQFLNGLDVVSNGIQFTFDSVGRSSGEAYVRFRSQEQAEKAIQRDRQLIGRRYIEIFRVGPAELRGVENMVQRNTQPRYPPRSGPYDRPRGAPSAGGVNNRFNSQRSGRYFNNRDNYQSDYQGDNGWNIAPPPPPPPPRRPVSSSTPNCVLMRGLPFKATEMDIRDFFSPLQPVAIHIIYDNMGRPSGTAKVQFACGDDMTRAMGKHHERMFTRYIELFVSSS